MITIQKWQKQDTHPINFMGFRTTNKGVDVKALEFVNSKSY